MKIMYIMTFLKLFYDKQLQLEIVDLKNSLW